MARAGHGRRVRGLPVETTSFVGRQAESARLSSLLEQARLVTLTGVGGVGKTRLALRAANAAHAAFPDGVWLVELSPLRDPALVGHVLLEALPLEDQTTRPVGEVLTEWLADKRLLLVLDSCEHLVAGCADTVETLLAAAPGLRILATSRQPLCTPGEQQMAVQPLPATDPQRGSGVEHSDAAVLFAQRAAAATPGFVLDEGNQETVAQICWHLDGIPLAIELAAARLPTLSLDQLWERLHSRFELLTAQGTGKDAGLPRHQMLRTTIGWSHELCAPLERLLWARLSVFAGGFDAAAAELVCSGGPLSVQQLPQVLGALVDKSIVSIVRQEDQADQGFGPVRYRMLDTVREYGRQWLREIGDEEQETQRLHRDYYLLLARRGDTEWADPDQEAWYERMVAEHANLRAALDFSLAEPDGHTALQLAGALWFFWGACGFQREGRRYLERALAHNPQSSPACTQALWACLAATFTVGLSLALRGELARAAAVFDEAPPAPGRSGGYKEEARLMSRVSRAFVHLQLGDFDQGIALVNEVRAECSTRGEQWMRTTADYVQTWADLTLGEIALATVPARAAPEVKQQLRDTPAIALAVDLLASTTVAGGEGERAARLLGLGQQIWQTVGPAQWDSPELVAAREACERQAREVIGDVAYEAAYQAGVEMDPEDGIAYALAVPPCEA